MKIPCIKVLLHVMHAIGLDQYLVYKANLTLLIGGNKKQHESHPFCRLGEIDLIFLVDYLKALSCKKLEMFLTRQLKGT